MAALRHHFELHLLAQLFRFANCLGVERLQAFFSLDKLVETRDEVIKHFLEALSQSFRAFDILVDIDTSLFEPSPQVFVCLV